VFAEGDTIKEKYATLLDRVKSCDSIIGEHKLDWIRTSPEVASIFITSEPVSSPAFDSIRLETTADGKQIWTNIMTKYTLYVEANPDSKTPKDIIWMGRGNDEAEVEIHIYNYIW
jgi:hypothetical protein